jgi:hypothetical protein
MQWHAGRSASCGLRVAIGVGLTMLAAGAPALAVAANGAPDSTPAVRQLAKDYPAGSITSAEIADRALTETNEVHTAIQREYKAEHERCEHVFMVNSCMDAARKKERAGESEVRRVNLEAHDLHRALDARADAQNRAEQRKQWEEQEALRPEREREAMAAYQAKQDNATQREQDALKTDQDAAQASATTARRQKDQAAQLVHDDALRPKQEVDSERAYRDKQVEAANYAKTRESDKEANAKRREERQASREKKAQEDAVEAASKTKQP